MRFTLKGRLALLLAALPLTALAQGGPAADFPSKPITFIVPFAAGSATDQIGRAIGQGVTEQTGQAVVIENKPGASAMIGASAAARAAPDGYTILITTNTTQAANEHLYKTLTYHPVKDYAPISLLGKGGQIMVVNPSSAPNRWAISWRSHASRPASSVSAAAVPAAASPANCCNRWPACNCCTCPTRATRWPSPTCSAARST